MTAPVSPVKVRVARASDEAQLAQLDRISWSSRSGFPSVTAALWDRADSLRPAGLSVLARATVTPTTR